MKKERYKMPVSVQMILTNEKNEILLLKRKSTGFSDEKYGLIGGHVEKNEDVKTAVIRETKEETNIDIAMEDIEFISVMNRKVDEDTEYIDFIFKAKKWRGNVKNMEPNKCSEIIWCKANQLPIDIIDFEKYIINNKNKLLLWGW